MTRAAPPNPGRRKQKADAAPVDTAEAAPAVPSRKQRPLNAPPGVAETPDPPPPPRESRGLRPADSPPDAAPQNPPPVAEQAAPRQHGVLVLQISAGVERPAEIPIDLPREPDGRWRPEVVLTEALAFNFGVATLPPFDDRAN
jgi:hypothetical protein